MLWESTIKTMRRGERRTLFWDDKVRILYLGWHNINVDGEWVGRYKASYNENNLYGQEGVAQKCYKYDNYMINFCNVFVSFQKHGVIKIFYRISGYFMSPSQIFLSRMHQGVSKFAPTFEALG